MSEYRPIELLKTAKDLCNFDAICVGGPLNGEMRSLGSLPIANLTEVIDSYAKSRYEGVRIFPYRLGSHMKYRLATVRRGLAYLAWLHDSVPCAANSALTAAFDSALELSKAFAVAEEHALEQAPFEPGDRVAPNGGYISDAVTVKRCFYRDGQWWFVPMHGPATARQCNCFVTIAQHQGPTKLDEESKNAAPHATPDPKHKVLTDDEMFGPSDLFETTIGDGNNTMYGIDWSKMDLTSYVKSPKSGPQYSDSFIQPFRVGQWVRRKSDGRSFMVEKIKYVESDKCWAIRIPGHDRPYDVAMFEPMGSDNVAQQQPPPPDPQPIGARPRRRIIRKERPE